VEGKGGEPKADQKGKVRVPGFSKGEYALPDFSKVDYEVPDFSKLDYTKGPQGEEIVKPGRKFERGFGEIPPKDVAVVKSRPKWPDARGFLRSSKEFAFPVMVYHGKYIGTGAEGRKVEIHYYDNMEHGAHTEWYNDGQKALEGAVRDDHRVAKWQFWHQNGKRRAEEWYLEETGLHGLSKEWHENGQKSMEVAFVNGKEHGPNTKWFPNGQKQLEQWYIKGVLHGTEKAYFNNGSVARQGAWVKGKREGSHLEWDDRGSLLLQVEFKAGDAIDFDHHQWTRAGLRLLLDLTAHEFRGGRKRGKAPTFYGEARFFKMAGRPDFGYQLHQQDQVGPVTPTEQDWTYKCRDGSIQLHVYTVPKALVIVEEMKDL
jgi:antitoxin component YwqK of YwqJK toxin-antitoxin module